MRQTRQTYLPLLLLAGLLVACGQPEPAEEDTTTSAPRSRGTIPITTRSDDAYDLYVEGRRLAERVRPTEARQLYLQALEQDRHFSLAHLALARNAPTSQEFFDALTNSVELS